jgi:NADPH:quinone reductase-like Zn-dependent oxidoreductase
MKAIVFEKTGNWQDVLQLKELTISEPAADEVQVQITARPINPSDEMFINGIYRKKPQFPQIAGLEGAGIIIKSEQDPSLLGKQVAFRAVGTWAEKINLKKDQFILIPESIAPEVACQISLNTLTAYALLEEAMLSKDQWLLVTAAAGAVATQLIQLASAKGIHTIAVVREEKDRQKLLALGATAVINSEKEELVEAVRLILPHGVNAAVDAIGGSVASQLYKVLAPFGTFIVYGRLSSEPVQYDNADIIFNNLTIKGFGIDAWMQHKTTAALDTIWQELVALVDRRKIQVRVDALRPLENVHAAISDYKKTFAKYILTTPL